jgi:hypothetical protein
MKYLSGRETEEVVCQSHDLKSHNGYLWQQGCMGGRWDGDAWDWGCGVGTSQLSGWTRRFKEINQHHLKSLSASVKKYLGEWAIAVHGMYKSHQV